MATYYIDPSVAVTGIGSEVSPYKTWAEITLAGSNTYLQKAGTIALEQVTISELDTVILGMYGTGAKPIIDGELTRDFCLLVEASNDITANDLVFRNGVINCFTIQTKAGTWTGPYNNFYVNRCVAHGCLQAVTPRVDWAQAGTGFVAYSKVNYLPGTFNNIVYTDCIAYDNAFHGFDVRNRTTNVTYIRCIAYENGTHLPGHNFTIHPSIGGVDNTIWTLSSAGIYTFTETTNDVTQHVNDAGTNFLPLIRNDAAGTTPAEGEWSRVGTSVYAHLVGGVDPEVGGNVYSVRSEHGPFLYEDCESYGCYTQGGLEGHGFAADDSTYGVTWKRCYSYNNLGAGFKTRFNHDVKSISCISTNNLRDGWRDDGTVELLNIYNFVSSGNTLAGLNLDKARDSSLINSIITDNLTTGLINSGASENCTYDYNCNFGNVITGTLGTNDITTDPILNSDYTLDPSSPCYHAGIPVRFNMKDFKGHKFNTPPTIGAYEFTSGSVALDREVA